MTKFKVGDKVRATYGDDHPDAHYLSPGETFVVRAVNEVDLFVGPGRDGDDWYLALGDAELVEAKKHKVTQKFFGWDNVPNQVLVKTKDSRGRREFYIKSDELGELHGKRITGMTSYDTGDNFETFVYDNPDNFTNGVYKVVNL